MTVQIDRRSKTHRGNSIATVFPYDFPIPDAESVRVYLFNEMNGSRTDLSDAQYGITGLGEDDFGSVTYPLAGSPIPATVTLTVAREVPYTQELDIHNQGGFYPEVLEDQLDLMVMQTQQVKTEAAGALRAQLGETFNRLPFKASLAGQYLKFDGTGEPFGSESIDLGSASFATEAEARAGTSTTTLMSPLRTFQAINERTHIIQPEDFIELAGSETAGMQQFFASLASEGGIGRLSRWYNLTGPIVVSGGLPFVVEGIGRYVSGLRRSSAAEFTMLSLECDEFVLRDFGIDGGRSTFASAPRQGILVSGSRWQITNVYVRDCAGTGIAGVSQGGVEMMGVVRNCHVDGTGGAEYGIALGEQIGGVVDGCFVENVHGSAYNVGIHLSGCSDTVVANSRVRNCFTGVKVIGGSSVGSNNQISDVLITSPNSTSSSGSVATGVWLAGGSSLAVTAVSIDGGNQPGFIGLQIANSPDGGAAVSFRASNCAGTGSYVLKILDTRYSLVTISTVYNVNTKFVHLSGTGTTHNTILLGRKEGVTIYAPWEHVQNDAAQITNLVQLLSGDVTQFVELDDDEAVSFSVVDGVFGLLEVSMPEDGFWFRGTARFSGPPAIFGSKGANTSLGTSGLTTGTSNGVDGDLNVYATVDALHIKNRVGGTRRGTVQVDDGMTPEELKVTLGRFSNDPLEFVQTMFPWGMPGELEASRGPEPWQRDLLTAITRGMMTPGEAVQIATTSGHGVGKSALVSWIILWSMATFEDTVGVVTANTETQLRTKTWVQLAKWFRLFAGNFMFRMTATAIFARDSEHERTWRVDQVPWSVNNMEAFAGLHNQGKRILVVFDEASGIEDAIWETTEGALTDLNTQIIWLVFGNPTRNKGRFRECFPGGRFAHRWKHYKVDSRQVSFTNQAQIARWIQDYGEDHDFVRVRVKGIFPRIDAESFIPYELARSAVGRAIEPPLGFPVVLGVDVGRFGDDPSVIYPRKGRDAASLPIEVYASIDTMQFAMRVINAAHRHAASFIFVDEGGVGGGVVDRLREMRAPVIGVDFGSKPDGINPERGVKYANKRAEIWGALKEWLAFGALHERAPGVDTPIIDELTGPNYGMNTREEIQLESKKEMRRRGVASPNVADALACTFALPTWAPPTGLIVDMKPILTEDYNPYVKERIYA